MDPVQTSILAPYILKTVSVRLKIKIKGLSEIFLNYSSNVKNET